MKTQILTLLLAALFSSHALAARDYWVERLGPKIVIGSYSNQGEIKFSNENTHSFCTQSKKYLKEVIEDYKKYKCEEDHELSRNFCKFIRESIGRANHGNNDFSTNLEEEEIFSLERESKDWEKIRRRVARRNNISLDDVVVANSLKGEGSPWSISKNSPKGFFTEVISLMKYDEKVFTPEYSSLQGIVKGRFLTCALAMGEFSISKKIKSKIVIEERFPAKDLRSFWYSFKQLVPKFDLIQKEHDQGSIQLLFLGSEIKEVRKRNFDSEKGAISSVKGLFKRFFTLEPHFDDLKIQIKSFDSLTDFENKEFPPKKYSLEYETGIEGDAN